MNELPKDPIKRFNVFRENPYLFLKYCVYTRDQVDSKNPIKLYPADKDYLRLFIKLWHRERMIAVPKSRRMVMSWTCIPLALWDCIFRKGKAWAFVSKKEEDSAELVERAEFVFNHIPPEMIPRNMLPKISGGKMKKSPPVLEFDFGNGDTSVIKGFPMGADQLRQFTFSGIFGDECAFWPDAENFYTGAKPTTDGGGKMILVSSRSPGFFKRLVFDKLDHKGSNFAAVPPAPVRVPMQGVQIWRNPNNGFVVFELSYDADPAKRSKEFREALEKSLPRHQFMREYGKSWETFEGLPVYPNYQEHIHGSNKELSPELGIPILLGFDFGLTPACVITQRQGNRLVCMKEFVSRNTHIKAFAPKVLNWIKFNMEQWYNQKSKMIYVYIDPAGFKRSETDFRTCALELRECGFDNIRPGPVDFEKRRSSVEHFLMYLDKEGPGLEVSIPGCPVLHEGFKGGYRYADSASNIEPDKVRPLKDSYSHIHDALQYVAYGALIDGNSKKFDIPRPEYGFAGHVGGNRWPSRKV